MNSEQLKRVAQFILNCEARRDSKRRLMIYPLPEGDGGGTFEIGGINDRYDHDTAYELRRLIRDKQYAEAEQLALNYYIENTNRVGKWSIPHPAIEAFLRDAAFNRGLGGAAKILQTALGVTSDGAVGPQTQNALRDAISESPSMLLTKLRKSCETYERKIAPPVGKRAKFWDGLVNRWNKREEFARTFI